MAVRKIKPVTPGQRHKIASTFETITSAVPEKSLLQPLSKTGGRNVNGKRTMRYIGGGHKKMYRVIDFLREKDGMPATVKTVEYDPYFLIAVKRGHESEVEEWVKRVPGGGVVKGIRRIEKDDLNLPNHLLGHRRTFLELKFANVNDLMAARRDIMPVAEKNKKNMNAMDAYAEVVSYVPTLSSHSNLD